jgi:hypothetical protein
VKINACGEAQESVAACREDLPLTDAVAAMNQETEKLAIFGNFETMLYSLRFFWISSRGYRMRPWRSPYLHWRIETFSGIPADSIDFRSFWRFVWTYRRELLEFLRWSAQMQRQYGMK